MFDYRKPHKVIATPESPHTNVTEEHESFGMIGFVRSQGGGQRLFGSHIEANSYFKLSIRQARVDHGRYGEDTYYASGGELIEVNMSAVQFAALITGVGQGDGHPCTITRVLGDRIEPVPPVETETQHIQSSIKKKIQGLVTTLQADSAKVKDLMAKPSISKADRASVSRVIDDSLKELRDNIPFLLSLFKEATEKTSQTAKAEVEAFIALNLTRLGLDAVKTMRKGLTQSSEDQVQVLELGDGRE